jgi:hypothetical protein
MVKFRSLNELDPSEGTVTLIDCISFLSAFAYYKAARRLNLRNKENTEIVLVPQPSDDVNDPLNWPTWKKALALIPIAAFSAMSGWIISGAGNGLVLLEKQFGTTLAETSNGVVTYCVLVWGIGVNLYLKNVLNY